MWTIGSKNTVNKIQLFWRSKFAFRWKLDYSSRKFLVSQEKNMINISNKEVLRLVKAVNKNCLFNSISNYSTYYTRKLPVPKGLSINFLKYNPNFTNSSCL